MKVDAAEKEEKRKTQGDVLSIEPRDDTVAVAGIRALRSNVSATGEKYSKNREKKEKKNMRRFGETEVLIHSGTL